MRRFHAVMLAGLFGAGTARAQQGQLLELRTPSLTVISTATEDRLTGPNVQLHHTESLVRGWAFEQQVVLTVAPSGITGRVGESLVDLGLERSGDALVASGFFGGRTARLRMSNASLSGMLNDCQFSLQHSGERYVGGRTCGISTEHEPVYLDIPPVLKRGNDLDLAAMLAVLLTSSSPGL